jgi:hypothetical protein
VAICSKSLKDLLDYDGGDEENVFCLTFSVNRERFGQHITVPLKANGAAIPVTKANKLEYVEAYVNYVLVTSVQQQYQVGHSRAALA